MHRQRLLLGALLWALLPAIAGADGAAPWRARAEAALGVPALRGARVAALVVRASDGEVLFARNPDEALIPASNMKLLTALAVLDAMGPTHRFRTRVLANEVPDASGAVQTLFVEGGGDPAFNNEDWWSLVARLKRSGLRQIRGDIVFDASALDGQRWHPSWGRTSARAYHAPVAGLTANYGSFEVVVSPGREPGDPVEVEIDPPVEYLRISNRARTGPPGSRNSLVVDRRAGGEGELVTIEGSVPASASRKVYRRSVLDPIAYAGSVFQWQLRRQGIAGGVKLRTGTVPQDSVELLSFEGRTLAEITRLFVKYSNNSVAESLVKHLGRSETGQAGTWSDGIPALKRNLQSKGLWVDSARIIDGSGLSYENRLTPRMIVAALRHADASFRYGAEFVAALAIARRDGTLARRAEGAQDAVRAKTGLLTRVTGLSGFAETAEGEVLVFSVLVNGYRRGDQAAMDAVDGFAEALVGPGRSRNEE
ncbi:MAG: D-alanyl-D-alanine carboxypeptidase/D-alanyl-D-alanine-endopeptidase [Myxococcota bacterium]|nr:D-alanyl-D-alanine carboxypeptidase/D-alanyl-D-alanine-endopeptidase [Myxococcota bacterium]